MLYLLNVFNEHAVGYVTCAGRKLNAEDMNPAKEMFAELLIESSKFQSQGGEPCASVGDFIRSEVHFF